MFAQIELGFGILVSRWILGIKIVYNCLMLKDTFKNSLAIIQTRGIELRD